MEGRGLAVGLAFSRVSRKMLQMGLLAPCSHGQSRLVAIRIPAFIIYLGAFWAHITKQTLAVAQLIRQLGLTPAVRRALHEGSV